MKRRRRNASLLVQVVCLLLATHAGTQAINALVMLGMAPPEPASLSWIDPVAKALGGRIGQEGTRFRVTVGTGPPADNLEDEEEREFRDLLARRLGVSPADVRVVLRAASPGEAGASPAAPDGRGAGQSRRPLPPPGPLVAFAAAMRQPDGQWRVAREHGALLDPLQRRTLLWLLGSVVLSMPFGYLFARRLTAPIQAFAEAAERLGRDPRAPALAVGGPAEVSAAARAFNEMQERLRRYVDDRTAMVGAIAHDLRTPLTRLAFRLEAAPANLRERAMADIAEMDGMISATLAFVRDATRPAGRERVDLSTLVESVVTNAAETGLDASFEDGAPLIAEADPMGMRRVVTNVVDNACRYGHRARARTRREGGRAVIEVDDDGPGLAAWELDRVFEPFYRAERSRSRATGGTGLGLAVVRAVVLAHGGEVVLTNRPNGGLRARILLPN